MKGYSLPFLPKHNESRLHAFCCDNRYRRFTNNGHEPKLLAIHGARSNSKALDHLLNELLLRTETQSISFDLSGHISKQDAAGEETSLRRNLSEAQHFAELFGSSLNSVIGYSMGGALALKIAELYKYKINKVVLVCPAVYTESAYTVPFGELFRSEISRPFSYLDSSSYQFLKVFTGQVLMIIGEYDGLRAIHYGGREGVSAGWINLTDGRSVYSPIPAEVIYGLEKAAKHNLKKIVIPDCDHFILSAMKKDPNLADYVVGEIADFLQDA